MGELSPTARAVLKEAGITAAEWIAFGGWLTPTTDAAGNQRWVPGNEWRGDTCGCTDDRCIGFHHDAHERCGCLDAQIEERTQLREAHSVWREYRAATEANDSRGNQDAYDTAWKRAEGWVQRYYPTALTFSLDALVKGRRGISVTHPGKDPGYVGSTPEGDGWRMLVWSDEVDENGHTIAPADEHEAHV